MALIFRSQCSQKVVDSASAHEAADIDPTTVYNDMIRECVKLGDVQGGEDRLRRMTKIGVAPNVLSFNLVLNSYAKDGEVDRAAALLGLMLHHKIEPNDVTYATICKVMAVRGLVAEIEKLMEQLKQSKVKLNVYFYGALISACGRCEPHDVLTAERAFKELVQAGLRPQSVKKSLVRVVGETQANDMILQAQDDKTPMQNPAADCSAQKYFDNPAYISIEATHCRMESPMPSYGGRCG
eukprot:CAMPEP_0170574180 /NCGR_PEP_ID=MMETSP0224-20130122/3161_1 /TAXON_ID=285029 /ORGANISM="Togula jolla, Strain CCCM 725" /LENGTH=238 /DNA_ID=CAMNT_0010896817 /DNA_START=18 /DNA_END=731 /DNA_ORIENTATION=-